MWNNEQRQEVRHMTEAKYRITMKVLGSVENLKERTYEGSAQGAFVIMSAWMQDAQIVANIIRDVVYVNMTDKDEHNPRGCDLIGYVDPCEKQ